MKTYEANNNIFILIDFRNFLFSALAFQSLEVLESESEYTDVDNRYILNLSISVTPYSKSFMFHSLEEAHAAKEEFLKLISVNAFVMSDVPTPPVKSENWVDVIGIGELQHNEIFQASLKVNGEFENRILIARHDAYGTAFLEDFEKSTSIVFMRISGEFVDEYGVFYDEEGETMGRLEKKFIFKK